MVTDIDVHIPELGQFFDHLDPSPLASRNIDPRVERFITDAASDVPRDAALGLVVHVSQAPGDTAFLSGAVHQHFSQQTVSAQRRLRELLRRARISLLIGLAFLAVALTISKLAEG